MEILRQLPFADTPLTLDVGREVVPVRPCQIIVWVSLSVDEKLEEDAPRFPTVLDTGHNHNFSIQERQLIEWAGIRPELLRRLGSILVDRQEVPLLGGGVWIHRNRPGTAELLPRPYRLDAPQGVVVYAQGTPAAPRLPLLGLRGLVTNHLRLIIDGNRKAVSLRKAGRR